MNNSGLYCELLPPMNSSAGVVDAARVSFSKQASNFSAEQNKKLLEFLFKHKHWAPFGHAREIFVFDLRESAWTRFLTNANLTGFTWHTISRGDRIRVWLAGSAWAWHENLSFLSESKGNAIRTWYHAQEKYKGLAECLFRLPERPTTIIAVDPLDAREFAGLTSVSFRVRAPIFVARQLVKHQKELCWNEESRRYIASVPELFIPTHWRRAPEKSIKQGSGEQFFLNYELQSRVTNCLDMAVGLYEDLMTANVAAEMARMVLPVAQVTEWIWTGSVRAFKRVCNERLDPHAQAETREVAQMIDSQIRERCPILWESLTKEPPYVERG